MSAVSLFNRFPCKTLSVPPPNTLSSTSKPSLLSLNHNSRSLGSISHSVVFFRPRPVSIVRAVTDDDEWGPEKPLGEEPKPDPSSSGDSAVAVAVAEEEKEEERVSEIENLKKALVDSFYGTDRGLSATSETRAEIVELITQLESKNPTPNPTEALSLLNGKWILAYTSFSGLFPLLSRGTLQLVKVDEISQTIDSENFAVQNSVQFSGPLATTSFSTNAKFEVRSPKRVQIKFEEGIIGTPQLTDSLVFPENLEFFGQKIDLSSLRGLFTSVQDTASSVAKTISSRPPLKFPLSNSNAESWLLTTYLDEELRISRGDAGSIFVLIKEGSSLLSP